MIPTQAEIDLKEAKALINSLQKELAKVKFENIALKEENERVNYLYQNSKLEDLSTSEEESTPKKKVPAHISRDEYNWGTLIKMYEKQLKDIRAEVRALRSQKVVVEPPMVMPVNIGHDEITEISNEGFSKKFVKIARQAVLVALRKESDTNSAAQSVIDYLRETR